MKKFLSGLLAGAVLFTNVGAFAASGKMIEVFYSVKDITINGESKFPTDANLKPFTYNNRTYVPLGFISENLDKKVIWDDRNDTVIIEEDESKYDDIIDTVLNYYVAYNEEDLNKLKDVLYSSVALDESYITEVKSIFDEYEYEYVIDDLEVISVDGDEALVRVKESARKIDGPDGIYWSNYASDYIYILYKEGNKWKLYDWPTLFQYETFDSIDNVEDVPGEF